MKSFIFKDQEYKDLPSLGYAFACDFNEALDSIKEKSFLKFVKKFKQYRKKIYDILYSTRYLQNALTFIIYNVTEEHLLVLGGKCYKSFEELRTDIKNNDSIKMFLSDKGFRNTFIDTLENEKEKQELIALEENFYDDFGIDYLYNYHNYPQLEDIKDKFNNVINVEKEKFKAWNDTFKSEDILVAIAQKYSLKESLDIHGAKYPIFNGFRVIKDQIEENVILDTLSNAFYWGLLNNLKCFKYKGTNALFLLNKLIKFKKKEYKKTKKTKKININEIIDINDKMLELYLEFVDLCKVNKILPKKKKEECQMTIPYCDTYACKAILPEEHTLDECESDKEYTPLNKVYYDLKKLRKSLRNHYAFSVWNIIFIVLLGIYIGVTIALPQYLKPAIEEKMGMLSYACFGALGLGLVMTIFILIIRYSAYKKYNKLCLLNYYRNNKSILVPKQIVKYEKILKNEQKLAKKIDRFYRFYGSICTACLTFAFTMITLGILNSYIITEADTLIIAKSLLTDSSKMYFLLIPMAVSLVLGLLRHKKTAWSVLLSVILGVAGAIGIIALAGIL